MVDRKKILINGELIAGTNRQYSQVLNPATEQVIAEVPVCTEEDVTQAAAAAAEAFKVWGETTPAERSKTLYAFADTVERNIDELADIESTNVGKPLGHARGEIEGLIDNLRFFAGAARTLQGAAAGEYVKGHTSLIRRDPIGVVGSITPWNYPIMIAGWKLGPALAAGNTVVLKPSEVTPLSTLRLAELSLDVLPKGVLNVVTGDGAIGEALVRNRHINMVSLTGSVRAGKSVTRDSAETLKKLHLELGGNAPVVIFDDADLDAAVEGVRMGGYYNAGQDCVAATRLYVSEKVIDEFLTKLVCSVESIRLGNPLDEQTEMGPLVSKAHFGRVSDIVERAKSQPHVKVLTGGGPVEGGGYFYKPTVITGLHQDDEIVREEVFGPVVTVIPFKEDQEALWLANDCQYGLAASVWTANLNRAMEMAKKLKFGTVWVNQHFLLVSEMPHGGSKFSGHGKDQSMFSIEEYTEIRHIMVRFA